MDNYPVRISVEEGIEYLLQNCSVVGTEKIKIEQSIGRILAKDQISAENIPPFNRSPLDGYAYIAEDTKDASPENPITLQVIEEVPAGYAPTKVVKKGQATKILTGAPIPEGADVVIKFEATTFTDETVTITTALQSGRNIIETGEDVKIGDVIVNAGTKISAATIGLLAGLGVEEVEVYKKPKVAIISTGDELVPIHTKQLQPGKIRNSSMYAIQGFLTQCGMDVTLCGIAKDDYEEIATKIDEASKNADLVITTGGVSVGDYDMLGRAVNKLQAKILFWKLQMKPGMAYLASVYNGKIIMSLSGNPGSASISMLVTGLPVFRKLAGLVDYPLKRTKVHIKGGFNKKSPGRRFVPGRLFYEDGRTYLQIADGQSNGMLHPLAGCDAIAIIGVEQIPLAQETPVEALLLDL